ncbi:MAG: hypothetical protein WBG57_00920, partial [Ornithinimicrobium sp.]
MASDRLQPRRGSGPRHAQWQAAWSQRGRTTLGGVVAAAMIRPLAWTARGQDAVVEHPIVVLDT